VNITTAQINEQFARMKPYRVAFAHAAKVYDIPVELLYAIASRETNCQNIIGDGGHGHGIMQIDDRSYPDFCHSGAWHDIDAAIMKGAEVFDSKRKQVTALVGHASRVSGVSFVGASLSSADLLRVATAAYNCGLWAYYNFSHGQDVDRNSTGKDYSKDVWQRKAVFAALLKGN